MSLEVKVNLCTDGCDTLNVYDITKLYSGLNTGGYGTINPELADLTITSITVTDPNGVILTPSSPVAASPDGNASTVIANYTQSSAFVDGIYTVEYKLANSGSTGQPTYTITCAFLISCSVEACLDSKLTNLKSISCGCENNDIDRLFTAFLMLESAKYSATCGKTNEAINKLNLAKDFCNFVECDSCN